MKHYRILLSLIAVISALSLAAIFLTLSGSAAAVEVGERYGPLAAGEAEACEMFGSREVSLCPEPASAPAPPAAEPSSAAAIDASLGEGFDDITLLAGAGWQLTNNSDPLGSTGWFQGNSAVFPAQQGAPTAYIAANFNNTAGTGTISNWLLTPVLNLADGSILTFWTRTTLGSIWPDRLQVRMSLNGASTNVGATANSVGDFTELLLDINSGLVVGGYPEGWTVFSVELSGVGAPATGRLAFRYFVENAGPTGTNSNYIGIDTVAYTPAPAISLEKTTGTDPSLCAANSEITVTAGSEVTYCFQVANTGAVTLTLHELVDSQMGTILSAFPYALAPGASAFLTQTIPITATTVNTATWTASNPGPVDVVSASAVATVTVAGEPAMALGAPALASSQPLGTILTQTLTISNTGTAPLNWEILEEAPASLAHSAVPAGSQPVAVRVDEAVRSTTASTGDLDCSAYENYIGIEPAGYAESCLKGAASLRRNPAVPAGPTDSTDTGYALDIGSVSDNFVSFTLNDFPGQTVVATTTLPLFGMDFDATGTTLYAIDNTASQIGTLDLTTAAFSPIGPITAEDGGTWTGLSIDPSDGTAYASSTNGITSTLYTVDLSAGSATPVGPVSGSSLLIDIAVGPNGVMYGHDIGTDSIYRIDKTTGSATVLGPTGYAANFAQGMDFDNADGTLYIFLYQGGGSNVYGRVNLLTGAVTPLAANDPMGEFEGATQTVSPCSPADIPWASVSPGTGSTPAGGSSPVEVTFDSTGLAAGEYTGELCVLSDDPVAPVVTVPLTLTVELYDLFIPVLFRED